jgi:oxygen-independent coproporphyrinogen-3 oxidase
LLLLERPRTVDTLFFGGGTPTHLPAEQLARLLRLVSEWFSLSAGGEFSAEANPLDLTHERLRVLQGAGITRLSLGAQSFQPDKLQILERDHQPGEIESAFHAAKDIARSVSLDLIFGTPGETVEAWENDLNRALALRPDHVSTYGLTIERGTSFYPRVERGELVPAPEEAAATMYERAIDLLTAAGYEHYEVSNFALPGHRCRHNETYWLGREYFAAGPGAARYVGGERSMNHRSTTTWMQRLARGESPVAESEKLEPEERARERLVFGLRRLPGIELESFARETGYTVQDLGGLTLERYLEHGWLELQGSQLRLTRRGLLISDSLWPGLLTPR